MPPDVAISIKHLGKDFRTSRLWGRKNVVTAVEDLSLDIPKAGIFVLLGSNGYVGSLNQSSVSAHSHRIK